jgi:hypothetical protein
MVHPGTPAWVRAAAVAAAAVLAVAHVPAMLARRAQVAA